MATSIGAQEAYVSFPELLERVGRGETISITQRGHEVARLVPPLVPPPAAPKPDRRPGWMKGQIWMAPDWEETPQEIIDLMEGKDEPQR